MPVQRKKSWFIPNIKTKPNDRQSENKITLPDFDFHSNQVINRENFGLEDDPNMDDALDLDLGETKIRKNKKRKNSSGVMESPVNSMGSITQLNLYNQPDHETALRAMLAFYFLS